jgi:hypothetical protein
MKKLLILILFSIPFCHLKAQTEMTCDYKTMYNSYVLSPTLFNLVGLIHAPTVMFERTMMKYHYMLTTDQTAYIASTEAGTPYYTISRTNSSLTMLFTSPGDFIDMCRKDLQQKTKSVHFDNDGYEVYRLVGKWDGIEYHYVFYLKESSDGGIVKLKFN